MKNRIATNSFRNIIKSFPRFLSLMVMSMLGVFAFSGLQATAPDMMDTLNSYLEEQNIYDVKIISTLGLTDEDLEALGEIAGIEAAEGSYSKDTLITLGETEYVINVSSLPEQINLVDRIKGSLPKEKGEIAIEENMAEANGLGIGDTITLEDDSFKVKTVKIVGIIDSALYYNSTTAKGDRGSTSVGSGTINYYAYCAASNYDQDYYSAIYCTIQGVEDFTTGSGEYTDAVDRVMDAIEDIREDREQARYDSLIREGNEELEKQRNEAYEQLDQAGQTLADTKETLADAKARLEESNQTLADAKALLDDAEGQLAANKQTLDEAAELIAGMSKDDPAYSQASLRYKVGYLLYQQAYAEYRSKVEEYEDGEADYEAGLDEYNSGIAEYEEALQDYEEAKTQVEEELSEAADKLAEIEVPRWYVYDRTGYSTYNDYLDDTNSVSNLATIFPVVFFAVAILVSLISMNRMVEDDRLEIGTLKSLGFSNGYILSKYLIFSLLATICGGLLGAGFGITYLPYMINSIYKILFDLPALHYLPNVFTTVEGILIAIVCVCGTSVYTALKELREKPASLMRPRAPKSGKRILLEKTFFWKRMKFSRKVIARNIFRYKKRVLVTILGIAGCTALMLCGFGIKDSIVDIPEAQYGGIFTYDGYSYVNGDGEAIRDIFTCEEIDSFLQVDSVTTTLGASKVSLFVAEDREGLSEFANLRDSKTGETDKLQAGQMFITEKIATLQGLKVGDSVELVDLNKKSYQLTISGIVDNYVDHYAYIDADTFTELGGEFTCNVVLFNLKENADEESLKTELLTHEEIVNVTYTATLIDRVGDMLKSLDKVVWILILLSALLSFVVLYNLSNINISERKREIATLKVLGFYDPEVDSYITKENIILTIIGIAIGLAAGFFLTKIVVGTIEIERCRFIYQIRIVSYVYSAIMAFCFTLVVNCVTHFTLKRIDMIESLKSVE